jgi:[acyl-carrier-protein] S-malonyltransferase
MGRDLAAAFEPARRTFEEADDCLGIALSTLCFEGPAETLARTEHAQPALLATSVAVYRVLAETAGLAPWVLAGHSLGEWTALVVAGALPFADALRGVRERGRAMQEAVPVGVGAMAAVMGLDIATLGQLCEAAAQGEVVEPANLNGAGQTVVAGHAGAVARVVRLAADRGARARALDVSAPFHCSLMAPAADVVARFLDGITLQAPRVPVVTSVEARPVRDRADAAALLVAQVTAPVRWEDTMRALRAFEPIVALELGPGTVLTVLAKRMWPELRCQAVGNVDAVARVREAQS